MIDRSVYFLVSKDVGRTSSISKGTGCGDWCWARPAATCRHRVLCVGAQLASIGSGIAVRWHPCALPGVIIAYGKAPRQDFHAKAQMKNVIANQPATVKAWMACLLAIEHYCPGLPEPGR